MNGDELCRHYRRIRQRLYDPPPALPPPPPPPRTSARNDCLTIDKIIRTTCVEFGCSRAELLSRSHRAPAVLRRFIAIGLSIRFVQRSLNQVGRQFRRDHSTVLSASRQMQPVIDAILKDMPEAPIADLVREMRRRLEDEGWLGKRTWEDCPCAAAEPQ
jgi:hypothetical protein